MSACRPVHVARAAAAEVPSGTGWLTPAEARVQEALRFERRATDWRLGRWVAKGAVAGALGLNAEHAREIEVLAGPGGAPEARVLREGDARRVSVSLSHSGGFGFAAASEGVLGLGCDVETVEARSREFVSDYFTESERKWIEEAPATRDLRANLLWSAKESALKALGEGLRLDTRTVEVQDVAPAETGPDGWSALAVRVADGRTFPGLWRAKDGRVWTIAADKAIHVA